MDYSRANFVEYLNESLSKQNSNIIIKKLENAYSNMQGRACFSSNLTKGQATPFLIFCLKDYFQKHKLDFEQYLEVGVLWGGSIMALYESGFSGTVYGSDIYKGYYGNQQNSESHKQIVINNCQIYNKKPILLQGDSKDEKYCQYIKNYGIKNIDVLLIDGDHSYEGAYNDFCLFSKVVRKGGLVLFDNYEDPGVQKAVKHAISLNNLTEHGIWRDTCWIGEYKVV